MVGLLGLLHVAGEDDAALEPHIFHFSLEARPVAAVANDNVGEFGYFPKKLGHELDHLVEAFILLGGYDPPDGHQHLAPLQPVACQQSRVLGPRRIPVEVNGVRNDSAWHCDFRPFQKAPPRHVADGQKLIDAAERHPA